MIKQYLENINNNVNIDDNMYKLIDIFYNKRYSELDLDYILEYTKNNLENVNLGVIKCYAFCSLEKNESLIEIFLKDNKLENTNNKHALNFLACIYRYGKGVNRDYEKAIKYYELAIKLNNSDTINNLGFMYHYGHGVKQNYEEAIKYFEMAIKLNNSKAMTNLG